MYAALFWAAFCGLMCLLYRRGFAVSKRIRAVLFVFRPGKNADRAALDTCTGRVRHAADSVRAGHMYSHLTHG